LALERLAVQYAAHQAEAADFAAMETNTQSLEEAVAQGITEHEAATLDIGFHDLIYRASRHQHVLNAWLSIRSQVYLFLLSRNLANPDFRERGISRGHREVLEALRQHDKGRAVQLIEDHLRAGYAYIYQNFPEDEVAGGSEAGALGDLALRPALKG
jgi:DNA-binding GntR family transcriptional regulator